MRRDAGYVCLRSRGLGAGAAPLIIVRVQGFGLFGAPWCLRFGGLVQV